MSDVFIYQDTLTSRTYLSIRNTKDTDINTHSSIKATINSYMFRLYKIANLRPYVSEM